ncbi:hypothetical protein PAMP_017374 [Pampus punctatissimus]
MDQLFAGFAVSFHYNLQWTEHRGENIELPAGSAGIDLAAACVTCDQSLNRIVTNDFRKGSIDLRICVMDMLITAQRCERSQSPLFEGLSCLIGLWLISLPLTHITALHTWRRSRQMKVQGKAVCVIEREMEKSTTCRVENGLRESDVNGSKGRFVFTRVLQKAAEKETE